MPDPAIFPAEKAKAEQLLNDVVALHDDIHAAAEMGIAGFPEYAAEPIASHLERAKELAARDGYTIAVAGTFSAGKSTFINALIGDPRLLPASAGECTLSITVIEGPGPGEHERVQIDYFGRDVAVANLLNHHKDFKLAASHKKEDWAGKDVETQIAFIKHMIDWLPTIADDASADEALQSAYPSGKVASEMVPTLKGFLGYLEQLKDRLGRTHIDATVTNASKYLAVEDDLHDTDPNYDKFYEIGHLLLIEKVTVFKNTALFKDAKIRIVDTPGTDSANPRQRDITHEYLKEADVVFSLLDPKGFTMANMEIIAEMAKANMGNIKDKMFFAINKLDSLSDSIFDGDKIGKYLQKEFHQKVAQEGLSPKHIYPMVAIIEFYEQLGDAAAVNKFKSGCADLLNRMSGVEEPWGSRVRVALEGRAVAELRTTLLKFIKEDVAFDRLRDIRTSVEEASIAMGRFLATNTSLIEAARNNRTTAVGRIREFIAKAQTALEANLLRLSQNLPRILNEHVFPKGIKPKLIERVNNFSTYAPDDVGCQREITGSVANSQAPLEVQKHWINWSKDEYCNAFVSIVCEILVDKIIMQIDEQVKESQVDKVLEYVSVSAGEDVGAPLAAAIEQAKQTVDITTRMRCEEETWTLRERDITPKGVIPSWTPQIDQKFKADIVQNYSTAMNAFSDKTAATLPRYYAFIIQHLIDSFRLEADNLEAVLINTPNLDLPTHLISGEAPDPEEAKRARLLTFANAHDIIKATSESLAANIG